MGFSRPTFCDGIEQRTQRDLLSVPLEHLVGAAEQFPPPVGALPRKVPGRYRGVGLENLKSIVLEERDGRERTAKQHFAVRAQRDLNSVESTADVGAGRCLVGPAQRESGHRLGTAVVVEDLCVREARTNVLDVALRKGTAGEVHADHLGKHLSGEVPFKQ